MGQKVQIIPNIFFLITFNTAYTTLLCTADVRDWKKKKKQQKKLSLPVRTLLTYIHTDLWLTGKGVPFLFLSFFLFCFTEEHLQESDTDDCVTGLSVGETARRCPVSVSAPTWLAVRATLLRVQVLCSGAVGRRGAILQKEAGQGGPHGPPLQSTRNRLLMQAVQFSFLFVFKRRFFFSL